MTKDVSRFLKSIKTTFPAFHKAEKRFFEEFSTSVYEYADEHEECTINELEENFGSPKDIVMSYYNAMEPDAYYTLMKKTTYTRRIFYSVVAVSMIILIATLSMLVSLKLEFHESDIAYQEVIITEMSDNKIAD